MNYLEEYLKQSTEAMEHFASEEVQLLIQNITTKIMRTRYSSGRIFLIGNGGSAATANHIRCDFEKGIYLDTEKRLRLKVVSLTDNPYLITAYINDADPQDMFVNLLDAYNVTNDDIIILISGSGTSKNIRNVLHYLNRNIWGTSYLKPCILGLTSEINKTPFNVDIPKEVYVAKTNNMQVAENMHLVFLHAIFTHAVQSYNNIQYKQ